MAQKTNSIGFLVVTALLILAIALFAGGFFTPEPDAPAQTTGTPPASQPTP